MARGCISWAFRQISKSVVYAEILLYVYGLTEIELLIIVAIIILHSLG